MSKQAKDAFSDKLYKEETKIVLERYGNGASRVIFCWYLFSFVFLHLRSGKLVLFDFVWSFHSFISAFFYHNNFYLKVDSNP